MKIYSDQDIEDLLVTAVEGGINYWATILEVNYPERRVTILDEENTKWEINSFVISSGILKYIEQGFLKYNYPEFTEEEWWENAPDAEDADIIVQLGLFGEVVLS